MKGMFYTLFKQNFFHKRKSYIKPPKRKGVLRNYSYVLCPRSLCVLLHLKLHPLTFLKGFETPLLNGGKVYKDIPLIVIAGYKAITLFLAEPLDGACELHGAKNLLQKIYLERSYRRLGALPSIEQLNVYDEDVNFWHP
jgi:hypothetical protein